MKTKTILSILLIGFQSLLFSQTIAFANLSFGHAPDCVGHSGICAFQTANNNKLIANTEVSFDNVNKEIVLIFNNNELDLVSKAKLLSNKLAKDLFLYNFDTDFVLPDEIKTTLKIEEFTEIKQGNYFINVQGEQIIMKLKLE